MGTRITRSTKASEIERKWYVIDADGEVLGRMASEAAAILRGKWKPSFTPHMDAGDHVVIVNAGRVKLTGRKLERKTHFRHSGYIGGAKLTPLSREMTIRPEEVVRRVVWGMLPHNRLGRAIIRKLKVYPGPEHPHQAQQPIPHKPGSHGHFFSRTEAPESDG